MVSRLDPSSESFLVALNRVSSRAERATRQISTGYRVTNASDDPDQLSDLLQARVDLEQTTQIKLNLGRVQMEADTAEQAVSSGVKFMDRARVIGAQGATGTATQDGRAAMADEVDGILRQMAGLSASTAEGRYVFGGDNDGSVPYTYDPAQPYPVSANNTAPTTRQIMGPSGISFPTARTAAEIFDSPASSVFQSLFNLSTQLRAGNQAGISDARS